MRGAIHLAALQLKSALPFFPRAKTPFFISVSRTSGYGRSYLLSVNVQIKLYRRYSSQPPLLPVQIVHNWQGADSLACNRLVTCPKGGHSASIDNQECSTNSSILSMY